MYTKSLTGLSHVMASVKNGQQQDTMGQIPTGGRLILKAGRVIDPAHNVDAVLDVALHGQYVVEVAADIQAEAGDCIINCENLLVLPGLIDMHLHLGDLFEVSTNPIYGAVEDGVTLGLSPGAGNTFLAPSLLGAEVDHGVPLNLGVYLGAASVLGSCLSTEELTAMFRGELDEAVMSQKMSRNPIAITTAALTIGIKDHMGHFILPDEHLEKIFTITAGAGLVFMSHTQDPEHTERLVALAKGRPLHLGHATAAGCGTHADPTEGMHRVLDVVNGNSHQGNITAEFVTTMLRAGRGSREGLQLPKAAQKIALDALASGKVDVLISDGQNQATMKGFGDTRDNIPAILELAQDGVLDLSRSVATMTANPARLLGRITRNDWWSKAVGHLGKGALGNVAIVDPHDKLATYTIVNGTIVSFENRAVRRGSGAGGWISRFGMLRKTGVGELAMFAYKR